MGLMVTELINQTDKTIGFEEVLDDGKSTTQRRWYMPLKNLAPNKTTNLIHISGNDVTMDVDYNIRLLMDGKSTGKRVEAYYFIACVRLVFQYDKDDQDVLIVRGVLEKLSDYVDVFLRIRGIGRLLGRKRIWDKRPLIDIELEQDPEPPGTTDDDRNEVGMELP